MALTVVVDLLSGYCKHNPSTWSNFPSSQGCALGAGTNSGFGWQRFKGRVGILMLVLAYSEGLGLGRALPLETSLFIFKQMSTGSISHLVSDNTCCVGSICPKTEGATSWVLNGPSLLRIPWDFLGQGFRLLCNLLGQWVENLGFVADLHLPPGHSSQARAA